MSILEIIISSLALAMDAFAVSVCKGLSMKKFNIKTGIIVGLYFGLFQSLMPLIGYFLGRFFEELIVSVDHWVAFVLLGIIGFNMIKESLSNEFINSNDRIDFKTMLPLAIATSIDALAVGITMAFLKVNIFILVLSIFYVSMGEDTVKGFVNEDIATDDSSLVISESTELVSLRISSVNETSITGEIFTYDVVNNIDAMKLAELVFNLGAGRVKKTMVINCNK